MQQKLDLVTFDSAKQSILALLFEDKHPFGGDCDKDIGYVKNLYDQAIGQILQKPDGDQRAQLLYFLYIVIGELLFKHIGVLIENGYIGRIRNSMEDALSRFNMTYQQVFKTTNTPNVIMKDEPLTLFVHLNSRILHNLAILIKEHTFSRDCGLYIHDWSTDDAETILSTHILTNTIATNVVALLTPAHLQLIQSKAEIPVENSFPKLYFHSEYKVIAIESLLTHIMTSSRDDPNTFKRRLAIAYEEFIQPKEQITLEKIESLLKTVSPTVPKWAIEKRSEIFKVFIQNFDTLKPAEQTLLVRKLMLFESQLKILFSTPLDKLQKNGGKPITGLLTFFTKETREMQIILQKNEEALTKIFAMEPLTEEFTLL